MKVFILLCVVGAALATIPADLECSENQHYEQCGTACPLTCKNYQNPPKFCVLMCVSGCFCDKGYVKTSDGRCVLPEQCPSEAEQVCGENQRYLECGTACPLTCDNYNNPPKICPAMCVTGCHCVKGYVKTADGRCVRPEQCPVTSQADDTVCELPAKRGLCLGYFPRYFFDKETKTCKKFIYGGCQGNKNNFKTKEECQTACGGTEEPQQALDRPDCDKAPETGMCRGYFPRFYYDQAEGMCKKFVYGGCGGNRNNFKSEDECYNKCGALRGPVACEQEKDSGPCRAYFRRYFFNKQTGQCEKFVYGGCQGNDNNFQSQEDCEALCLSQ